MSNDKKNCHFWYDGECLEDKCYCEMEPCSECGVPEELKDYKGDKLCPECYNYNQWEDKILNLNK